MALELPPTNIVLKTTGFEMQSRWRSGKLSFQFFRYYLDGMENPTLRPKVISCFSKCPSD